MEKKEQTNGDYSTLAKPKENIFFQKIDLLKSWRKRLWESVFKGSSAFLVPHLDNIIAILDELTHFKQYASDEVYKEFVQEYYMTMLLLQKCLIKSVNEGLLPHDEVEQLNIQDLISKIENLQQNKDNMESILASLREEDPSTQLALENLGLSQEKIEEIISTGYTVESVLDVKYSSELRK